MAEQGTEAKLAKLEIRSHTLDEEVKPDKKANLGSTDGIAFQAYYNPASFASEYAIEYDADQEYGDIKISAKFKKYTATNYSFSLLIDGTGSSIPDGLHDNGDAAKAHDFVPKKVQEFMDCAYKYDGEQHRPKFLSLVWGSTFVPRCVLMSFSLNYDLFWPDGTPLRATIACKFQEYSYRALTDAEKDKKSPDMTHMRIVKQGDRLPLMCERIYGDAKVYLEIARYNKLTNYRNLQPGQKLYFPPLITKKA